MAVLKCQVSVPVSCLTKVIQLVLYYFCCLVYLSVTLVFFHNNLGLHNRHICKIKALFHYFCVQKKSPTANWAENALVNTLLSTKTYSLNTNSLQHRLYYTSIFSSALFGVCLCHCGGHNHMTVRTLLEHIFSCTWHSFSPVSMSVSSLWSCFLLYY